MAPEYCLGATNTPPVVALHGFTQNRRCWGPFADLVSRDHRWNPLDLPGHGLRSNDRRSFDDLSDELVEATADGVLLGYSMGGRVALHVALHPRQRLKGLVLMSTTAGIDNEQLREKRRHSDAQLGERLKMIGLEPFLNEWSALPLFVGTPRENLCTPQRLTNDPQGLIHALLDLGTGVQAALWDRLDTLGVPTLIIVGEHDEHYRQLGSRLHADIAGSTLVTIANASHAPHLCQPERTAQAVVDWIRTEK